MLGLYACFLVGYYLQDIYEESAISASILLLMVFLYVILSIILYV